jgi:hypothetical protein
MKALLFGWVAVELVALLVTASEYLPEAFWTHF